MKKMKKTLAAQAGQVLLEQLPVDQKTLRRAAKLLEPKTIKRLAILAAGGAGTLSLLGSVGQMRLYRALMARELKKQLAPVNKKLEQLERQNEELQRQNEALRKQLAR